MVSTPASLPRLKRLAAAFRQRLFGFRLHQPSMLLFSMAIGIAGAMGALFFRSLIELFQWLIWGLPTGSGWTGGLGFTEQVMVSPWWLVVSAPAAAGLVAGWVITRWVPEARGPGVTEVILAVTSRHSTMRHRVTTLKSLVTSLLIGAGASVGREGPIVQIGASLGASLSHFLGLPMELRRVCLASGAAAGIAATFNAPMAGTLFAAEVILLDIEVAHISHIVVAAVTASVLSRLFWGEFPTIKAHGFALQHSWELGLYLLLGLLAAVVAVALARSIFSMEGLFARLKLPQWLTPGLGGLALGFLGLALPGVLGVGYETVNMSLEGQLGLGLASALLLGKLLACSLCIGSGMSGGIFAPSLVLGGSLGTVLGLVAVQVFPDAGLVPQHYALAGMGAVVAGTTLAPITAVLTIFELTYSQKIILPLLLACIASTLAVRRFFGYSIYEVKLLRQGVDIVRGHDVGVLRSLRAGDLMSRDFESLRDSAPVMEIMEMLVASSYPHFPVVDAEGRLVGMLSLRDVQPALGQLNDLAGIVVAADLMTRQPATLTRDDSLEHALHLFESRHISCLPVIESAQRPVVAGILKKDDFLQAYREKVLKDRILSCPVSLK